MGLLQLDTAAITGVASGTTSTVALAILALAFYLWTAKGSAMQHLPPAPKGYPFLGNLMDVVSAGGLLHLKMIAWAQDHGEIIRVVLGPNTEPQLATISGFYIADIFTALDYLPLALKPWAKNGIKRHNSDVEFVQNRMNYAKKLVNSGSAPDSFMTRVLTSSDKSGASETEAAYVALKLIAAASDTMMMNPRVQLHARKVIDDAVGDRLPVWGDIERIPYVRYLMKETWRMRPPVGNALAHRITADIAYEDYVIPAGSTVRPNIWAIGRDPKRHPDPDTFRPERWEGDELSVS
ncbi:Cytochrome P450 monooxygenase yanC [Colletotrichum sp. SAR11_240]|nr:Cytochrome P450 monooxygenase yanC [Colletotrichum sp. SAR11_240]